VGGIRWATVAVATFALVMTSCAGGEETTEETTTTAEEEGPAAGGDEAEDDAADGDAADGDAADGEPTAGGTLVVAISSDPGHLNPAITTSGGTHTAAELLYNGLLALDEEGEPVPALAHRWEVQDDGRTYRFELRDDVNWHDGEAFTSRDVQVTFEQLLLELHSRTAASVGQALERIETPDDHTVVFHFDGPYSPFLQQLDVTEAPILPAHVYDGTDPQTNEANLEPVGTGPFRLVSYRADEEIRLERNDDYFDAPFPYLDEVVMRIIPDETTQLLALEQGEVDFLWGVPGPERDRVLDDAELVTASTASNPGGSNCIMTMSFNLENPVLEAPELRRALAHAIDRDRLVEQVTFGEGQVAEAPISSGIGWAHHPDVDLPEHDPETAARLLDEAGWSEDAGGRRVAEGVAGVQDGTPLELDLVLFPTFSRYADAIRDDLAAVGIDLEQRQLEPPVFAPTVFDERDFDLNVISYCNGPDPEVGVRRMYDSSQIGPAPFTNAAAYRNDDVDAWFDQAVATVDREERADHYARIQQQVAEDLPYVWLVETMSTRVWRAECSGFQPWTGLFAETASCEQ
jgi:peptide/nickel transport system substrate-binding protein